jgi:hypothetical protein
VHLAHLARGAGVKEDSLGRRGFPSVDVRHDSDVPDLRYGKCPSHDYRGAFPTLSRSTCAGSSGDEDRQVRRLSGVKIAAKFMRN